MTARSEVERQMHPQAAALPGTDSQQRLPEPSIDAIGGRSRRVHHFYSIGRKDYQPQTPPMITVFDFRGAPRLAVPQEAVPVRRKRRHRESVDTPPSVLSDAEVADIAVRAAIGEEMDQQTPPAPETVIIPSSEARLIAAAKTGDEPAFTALVEATQADVYTLAYRITGNEDDARDVAQEAYLRAFRSLKRFRGDARFSTWMYRITANEASRELIRRSTGRHEELSNDDSVLDERPESDPEAMAEAGALRERVTAALASLPPLQRAIVVLRDIYDLPHKDIARELGISNSASKVRLHDARKNLQKRLFPMPGEEKAREGQSE